MKHLTKMLSFILSVLLLSSLVVSSSAIEYFLDYPIHDSLSSNEDDYYGVTHVVNIPDEKSGKRSLYFALLWTLYSRMTDEMPIPEEYLAVYNDILKNSSDDNIGWYNITLDSSTWKGKELSLEVSMDFLNRYRMNDTGGVDLSFGHGNTRLTVAIWDKDEGKYITVETGDQSFYPEHDDYSEEELVELIKNSETGYYYDVYVKGTGKESFVFPDYFDSSKHEIHLFVESFWGTAQKEDDYYIAPHITVASHYFSSPIVIDSSGYDPNYVPVPEVPKKEDIYEYGDANMDGALNLVDAALILRYIAGWDGIVIDTDLSDINKSGSVGLSDVLILLRKIVNSK